MPLLRSHHRTLRTTLFVAIVTLALASCGSDSTPIEAGGPAEDDQVEGRPPSSETLPDESGPDAAGSDSDRPDLGGGYELVAAMPDIVDPQVATIDDVIIDADDVTLVVRYVAAAEPCSGAIVEVAEAETSVAVTLKTGLNPNAAAMTCVAGVFGYEQAVPLSAPLAGRDLIIVGSATDDDPDADGADTLTPPGGFVGLPLEEAQRLAEQENRAWRIGRQDGESFALTEDYNEQRVTFEVDDGVVTAVTAG